MADRWTVVLILLQLMKLLKKYCSSIGHDIAESGKKVENTPTRIKWLQLIASVHRTPLSFYSRIGILENAEFSRRHAAKGDRMSISTGTIVMAALLQRWPAKTRSSFRR